MKSLIQKEGFNLSNNHQFGNPELYLDKVEYLFSYIVQTENLAYTERLSSYITDDNYLQLCRNTDGFEPIIVAQERLKSHSLSLQRRILIKKYFEELRAVKSFPNQFIESGTLWAKDFEWITA